MPFVTASDGTELFYEVEGEGFPLVFTHGNMCFGQTCLVADPHLSPAVPLYLARPARLRSFRKTTSRSV